MTRRSPARRSSPPPRGTQVLHAPVVRTAIVGLAAIGFIVSAYLTYASHRLHSDANFKSLCALNDLFDCDRVVSSPYGSLSGIPLAWFGAWFYAFLAVVALCARRPAAALGLRSPALLLLLLSTFAGVLSVALAAVSLFILGSVCLLCATLYAVNICLVLAAWMALRSTGETFVEALFADRRRYSLRRLLLSTSLIAAGLILVSVASYRLALGPSRFCELVAGAHAPPGRPLRLTIFTDVQCPHCVALDKLLRPIRSLPGLEIISRQYPLDSACNPRVKAGGHFGACLQAQALLCARTFGRYNELSERLYDGGPNDQDGLVHLAGSLGIDESAFGDCLESSTTLTQLASDLATGRSAGVRGTPTIVLENGTKHFGALSADDIACLRTAVLGPAQHP